MRTLIVHPTDQSTNFLKPIYAPILDKTVVTGGVSKFELRELIKSHHRVIILGHGTRMGLLAVGQFPDAGFYIVDESLVDLLSEKADNIYIWCYASEFMSYNQLCGFGSGMFISELEEAFCLGFWDSNQNFIDESNNRFASVMSKFINHLSDELKENVIHEYAKVAETNPIAEFNVNRLFLNISLPINCI